MKKYILIISGFGICLLLGLILQIRRSNKLRNNVEATAIVTWRAEALGKGHGVRVKFKVKNMEIETSTTCNCRDIEVGDTVLIKYAVEDPELAVMEDKYYMQKYKHLK